MPLDGADVYPADERAVTCDKDTAILDKEGLYEIHYAVSCENIPQGNISVALEINGKIKTSTLRNIANDQKGTDHTLIYQAAKGDTVRLTFEAPCNMPKLTSALYIKYYSVKTC